MATGEKESGLERLTGRATSSRDCEEQRGLWVSWQFLMVGEGCACVNGRRPVFAQYA